MGIYVGDKRYAPYIGDKRREVRNKKALPYDAEIEYLESSGTQLLDTGISGGSSVEYSIDFVVLSGNSNFAHICGASRNEQCAPKIAKGTADTRLVCYWYTTREQSYSLYNGTPFIGARQFFEYKDGSIYLNNVLKNNSVGQLGFGSQNFCIFGYHPENLPSKMQLYSCKIKKDGVLVRNLIPVRVGPVGYMYDKVSGELFGNEGTGDFILGNDKN